MLLTSNLNKCLVKRRTLGEKDLNTPFTSLSNRNVQQYLLSFVFVVELRFWYAQKWPIVSPVHDFLYPHRISYLSLLLCQMLTVDFRHFCDKQDKKRCTDKLNESNLATGVIFARKTMNKKKNCFQNLRLNCGPKPLCRFIRCYLSQHPQAGK